MKGNKSKTGISQTNPNSLANLKNAVKFKKGQVPWNKGKMKMITFICETCGESITRQYKSDRSNRFCSIKCLTYSLKLIDRKLEKASNWQGGKSFEEYPTDWSDLLKESIRVRDNFTCQECGIHQDELERRLHIHHIDYIKTNCDPSNLICLCNSCHMKTNFNRDYWINYFKNNE